jgi:alanine-glyoxylate transaminase/serine-glyoxylate transaminase/serine-pyruvate transaminase
MHEEGFKPRWRRHEKNSKALIQGLKAIGLEIFSPEEYRCPAITAIKVPENISDINVRTSIRKQFGITISGGLGELKGLLWRIGLMGMNSSERNVILILNALEQSLNKEEYSFLLGTSIAAAMETFSLKQNASN